MPYGMAWLMCTFSNIDNMVLQICHQFIRTIRQSNPMSFLLFMCDERIQCDVHITNSDALACRHFRQNNVGSMWMEGASGEATHRRNPRLN